MPCPTTEERSTGAFRSLVNLKNLRREREPKRICNSEPFIKPRLSLSEVIIPLIWCYFKLKKPQNDPKQTEFSTKESKQILSRLEAEQDRVLQGPGCPREEKTIVLQDSHKPKKEVQMPITDNSRRNQSQEHTSELQLLKQRVKSEQKSVSADGLQIEKKVWEYIRKPSATVNLDPNTANPTLKLSADGRSVRTMTHKEYHFSQRFNEHQRKPKHHYNGWMCVQAEEGYSTGRHYWQVDVKGKRDWRIGVVKESAPRKGYINLNTAAGYWTLRLQLGSLMALTVPVTKLNHAPPSKVGVRLDLERGQVSFYDAEKRKHIYTFEAEFEKGEKIFPVFGTVETDKPLKII